MELATVNAPPVPAVLRTKQHFEVLDGLRGVAAVVVVIFHFMEFAVPDYNKSFVGHGFLACRLLLCLSGFVLGYAYDDRIRKIGATTFLKSRLIRLHPMVILGSVLGVLALFIDPFATHLPALEAGKVTLVFLASVFLVPLPIVAERLFNLFSLNAPSWSLFWEYVANIIYAFLLFRIGRRPLLGVAYVAMVAYDIPVRKYLRARLAADAYGVNRSETHLPNNLEPGSA